MSKSRLDEIREDLRKADAGCGPGVYCEYSCANCAADSQLEDDGVKNVRFLLAEIDKLQGEYNDLDNHCRIVEGTCANYEGWKDKLLAENKKLSEALRFYAGLRVEVIRECGGGMCEVPHRVDLSEKARKALSSSEGEEK